jgi:carboxyvinyl-carboxyphosphonate phosphorylmutase
METRQRRENFRAVLASGKCVFPASVFDPMSAKISEDLGYEVGMIGGSVVSAAVLGAPDLFVLTLSEFVEQVRRTCRYGALPIAVDADHGYGNALSVMRTVEELETTGVSALTIEDTDLPQRFGQAKKETLISIEEGIGKMRAALKARTDTSLVIIGRTSAPGITGVDDTIARCRAYQDAGVDALFIKGVKGREDLEKICGAVNLPVVMDSGAKDLKDRDYLGRTGVRIALQGHAPFAAAIEAIYRTAKAMREGTPPEELKDLASGALMRQAMRGEAYDEAISAYLG